MGIRLGMIGFLVGGLVGFMLRPSAWIIGKLPFEVVITRGLGLGRGDQILLPLAQKSFDLMLTSAVIGAVIGILIGYIISKFISEIRSEK